MYTLKIDFMMIMFTTTKRKVSEQNYMRKEENLISLRISEYHRIICDEMNIIWKRIIRYVYLIGGIIKVLIKLHLMNYKIW